MKTISLIAAAVALGAVAVPAFAADQSGQETVKAHLDAKTGKYCVSQVLTGSRLPVTDCRTKEEWAKASDPSAHKPDMKLAQK